MARKAEVYLYNRPTGVSSVTVNHGFISCISKNVITQIQYDLSLRIQKLYSVGIFR